MSDTVDRSTQSLSKADTPSTPAISDDPIITVRPAVTNMTRQQLPYFLVFLKQPQAVKAFR